MKSWMLGMAAFFALALVSKADPFAVCTNLVGSYLFEHLGHHQDGAPFQEASGRTREMVRVQPGQSKSQDK